MSFLNIVAAVLIVTCRLFLTDNHGAIGEMIITPLWATSVDDLNNCQIYLDDANETVTLTGSPLYICSLHISTTGWTTVRIPENLTNDSLIYIERDKLSEECRNVVEVIHGGQKRCSSHIPYTELHLNIHGNASIVISESTIDHHATAKCLSVEGTLPYLNQTTPSCNLETFDGIKTCEDPGISFCKINFPPTCSSELSYNQVLHACSDGNQIYQEKVLIIYPNSGTYVDLSKNGIANIAISAFRESYQFETLNLGYNEIGHLSRGVFNGLTKLTRLILKYNSLTTLVSGLFDDVPKLSSLDFSSNDITMLPSHLFSNLTKLEVLILRKNQLFTIPVGALSGLRNLKVLNFYSNQISTLPPGAFQDLESLEILDLARNQLEALDGELVRNLLNLTGLFLERNQLSDLTNATFQGLINLDKINLADNQLTQLDGDVFRNASKLTRIYLRDNNLFKIHKSSFLGLISLQVLDLSDNKIQTLQGDMFNHLSNLDDINFARNSLTTLDADLFRNLSNLRHLNLERNEIQSLDNGTFKDLHNLIDLDLARNNISIIDSTVFQGLFSLQELPIYDNQLEILDENTFAGLINVKTLSVSDNYLRVLPPNLFRGLVSLQVLSLDANLIEYLPSDILKGLFDLQILFLGDNNLKYLQKELLSDLGKLDTLTIKGNKLKRIDSDIFINNPSLSILDLSSNMLTTVPNFDGLDNLFIVNLKNNSLRDVKSKIVHTVKNDMFVFASQHEICDCYVPWGANCSASSQRSPFLTCDRLLSDRVLVAMMWLIGLNALGGNAFVLWYKRKNNRNKVQTFLCSNLALSDFLMGVYMVLIAIADIYFGESFPMLAESWRKGITCKVAGTLSIVSSESSVFFVTLISVDRFISVKFSRSRFKLRQKSTKVVAVVVWAFSVTLGLVPSLLAGRNPNFYDNSHVCIGLPLALYESYTTTTPTKTLISYRYRPFFIEISRSFPDGQKVGMYFSTAVFLGLNCACYFLILICYVSIIRTVYLSSKRAGLNSEMKTQIRLTLKVAAIVTTDFVCWFPIILLGILVQADALTLPPSVFAWAVTFVLPINSAINPYLYTIADIISSRRKGNEESMTETSGQHSRHNASRSRGNGEMHSATASTFAPSSQIMVNTTLPNVPDRHQGAESDV